MIAALTNMSEEIKALFDSIHNPVVAIDAEGRLAFCNLAGEKIMGRPLGEIKGRKLTEIIKNSQLYRILKTGRQEVASKIDIDGQTYTSNRTIVRVGVQVIGAVAVLQDISELESISNDLEHTKLISAELAAIIESSFDGIYVTDGRARTIRVNSAYERITGIKREEVLGRTMGELVDDGFFNESVTLRVLETHRPTSLVQKVKTGKTVMVTGNPIFDGKGQIRLVVTNVRDVTELNRLQEKLESVEKRRSEAEMELTQLRGSLRGDDKIVFRSNKIKELMRLALRLAWVDTTVLIQGESGVGKEVFADIIHANGNRRDMPLIKINCASFPEQLLESELFGYAPGAFTGAKRQGKTGLFEAAQGGTICLDEIGELPLGLQAKLLRVLQSKEIYRVGSTTPITVDVRIVAITNRDLRAMTAEKKFRDDLFFRLNVVNLVVPALRERPESILPFVYHFIDKYNKQYGFSKQIDREVVNAFLEYDWPGNVRELENLIEQLVVVTAGEVITRDNLPERWAGLVGIGSGTLPAYGKKPLPEILAEVERSLLEQAMTDHKTTRKAAEALMVNQSTVVRKLQRYGVSVSSRRT
jgi:PAS domain S-box-containing protein